MQFKIEDVRLSTVSLLGPYQIHVLFPTDLLTDIGITKELMKVGGIITMDITYGCCNLFVKYRCEFESYNNDIYFCLFCGTRVNDEVQHNSSKQNQEEETK